MKPTNFRVNNSKVYKCPFCGKLGSRDDRARKNARDAKDDGRRSERK